MGCLKPHSKHGDPGVFDRAPQTAQMGELDFPHFEQNLELAAVAEPHRLQVAMDSSLRMPVESQCELGPDHQENARTGRMQYSRVF